MGEATAPFPHSRRQGAYGGLSRRNVLRAGFAALGLAAAGGLVQKGSSIIGSVSDTIQDTGVRMRGICLQQDEVQAGVDATVIARMERRFNDQLKECGYRCQLMEPPRREESFQAPEVFVVSIRPCEFAQRSGNVDSSSTPADLESLCACIRETMQQLEWEFPGNCLALNLNIHPNSVQGVQSSHSLENLLGRVASLERPGRSLVRQLDLSDAHFGERGNVGRELEGQHSLPSLQSANVSNSTVTDDDMVALSAAAPNLKRLNIGKTLVQDSQSFRGLPLLSEIYVHGTTLSIDDIQRLRRTISIHVDERQEAQFMNAHPELGGRLPKNLNRRYLVDSSHLVANHLQK